MKNYPKLAVVMGQVGLDAGKGRLLFIHLFFYFLFILFFCQFPPTYTEAPIGTSLNGPF